MTPIDTSNSLQDNVVCLLPVVCEKGQWWIQHSVHSIQFLTPVLAQHKLNKPDKDLNMFCVTRTT